MRRPLAAVYIFPFALFHCYSVCIHHMTARSEKKTRVVETVHRLRYQLPHMSQSALVATIRELSATPIDAETLYARDIRAQRRDVAFQSTPYGPLHQTRAIARATGGEHKVLFANPLAMMSVAASTSEPFCKLIEQTLERHPCTPESPWRFCIYADEITPGNALSYLNHRKVWSIYYSFLDFGCAALSSEWCWFTATVIRSTIVQKSLGGLSAFVGEFLRLMFCTDHCVATGGFSLHLTNGRVVRIFCRLACMVSDEAALKAFWQCKGAGGLKSCMLCANCVDHTGRTANGVSLLDFDASGRLVPGSCSDIRQFVSHTRTSVMVVLEHLNHTHSASSKTILEKQEKLHGWLVPTHNLLMTADIGPLLDPTTQTCFDWVHCYLVHSLFNKQTYELLEAIAPQVTRVDVDGYMQLWHWPKRLEGRSVTGKQAFGGKRSANSKVAKTFNASASEALSIYPVLANFLRRHCLPAFHLAGAAIAIQHCEAFFALCLVLDLLMHVHDDNVTPDLLEQIIAIHANAFLALLGPIACIPKYHFALHLAGFLKKFGYLPNCLVHERKHKLVKRFIEDT